MKEFTLIDREILYRMLKEKQKYRKIKLVIKKSISSISDEVSRNSIDGKYDPYEAQYKAEKRKREKSKRTKLEISKGLREYVIDKIRKDWSPEQISDLLKRLAKDKNVISHETIYSFIYSKEGKQLKLWKHLRHKKKPQRKHWGTRKKRTIIPNRVTIHERPALVNRRERFGDYEGDLMIFSNTKKVLAVHVERLTRKVFLTVNDDKTAQEMECAIHELICTVGQPKIHSITYDNGSENVCHEKIRSDYCYSFDTYFCDPYCSWQKGTVENTNKLLRQYLPRDISPDLLTQDFVEKIAFKLNNRPRKCLNYLTPNQFFISCSD